MTETSFFFKMTETVIFTGLIERVADVTSQEVQLAWFDEAQGFKRSPGKYAVKEIDVDMITKAQGPTTIGLEQGKTYTYQVFPNKFDGELFGA